MRKIRRREIERDIHTYKEKERNECLWDRENRESGGEKGKSAKEED